MFGIKRFDPGAKPARSTSSVDRSLTDALTAKLTQKRKRVDESPAASSVQQPVVTEPTRRSSGPAPAPADGDEDEVAEFALPNTRRTKARVSLGFTGANALPLPTEAAAKTKAKQRYLRKKKERRKAKKRSTRSGPAPSDGGTTTAAVAEPEEEGASLLQDADSAASSPDPEEDLEVEVSGKNDSADPEVDAPEAPPAPTPVVEVGAESSRVRKRPKNLDRALAKIEKARAALHPTADDDDAAPVSPEPEVVEAPATHPGALPRFPEPRPPTLPDIALLSRLAKGLGGEDDEDEAEDIVLASDVLSPLEAMLEPASTSGRIRTPLLSKRGTEKLATLGIKDLFAVQVAVLPLLLGPIDDSSAAASLYPLHRHRDICVTAPTGSGKTLSYVIPIVETLALRTVPRIRALVLVPTKDLVQQVKETFDTFARGTGLETVALSGHHNLAREQSLDIVVATPGRLLDYLESGSPLSLQHLRFLVIDEADRLMSQLFHQCLARLDVLLQPAQDLDPPSALPVHRANGPGRPITQKLLFSATLGHEPAKLTAARLYRPIFLAVRDQNVPDASAAAFGLPASLKEFYTVAAAEEKPLVLFHLVEAHQIAQALCFCKSVEAAVRLAELATSYSKDRGSELVVASMSSDLPGPRRAKLLDRFQKGEINLLVCSDLISRGLDLPDVPHVISYDTPVDLRKYVHRVGRTARAGREGSAWTLVEPQEMHHFKALRSGLGGRECKRVRIAPTALEPLAEHYKTALSDLAKRFGRTTGSSSA